jgi:hypothetical protein
MGTVVCREPKLKPMTSRDLQAAAVARHRMLQTVGLNCSCPLIGPSRSER